MIKRLHLHAPYKQSLRSQSIPIHENLPVRVLSGPGYTVYFIQYTVFSKLYILCCILYPIFCILYTIFCIQYTLYCILYIVYCILYIYTVYLYRILCTVSYNPKLGCHFSSMALSFPFSITSCA